MRANSLSRALFALAAVLCLALSGAAPATAQTPPSIVSTVGYINGTPLAAHTTAVFDTSGASTLVVFVSSHPDWNGQPVSLGGLTDSAGNTWTKLTGPTTWAGSTLTLLSAIYFVNAPATSAAHTVTVNLTNPAPLVIHVFAVSGSDVTVAPISSAITSPASPSLDVISTPIAVPANTLLLAWAKNEMTASADSLDGYSLDAQSTSFLWAESRAVMSAGSYTGHFQYSSAIGWQTAIVGVTPSSAPVASSQSVTTVADQPVNITVTAASPMGLPLTYTVVNGPARGALSGTAPDLTYTPNPGYVGNDSFTFKANDGTTDSNIAVVSITIRQPGPAIVATQGYINGSALTSHPSTAFNSVGSSTLIAFVSTNTPWNGLPVSIGAVTDSVGNTWSLLAGPTTWVGGSFTLVSAIYYVNAPATSTTHTVTVNLSNPAPLVFHVLAVSGSDTSGPPVFSSITDPGAGTSTDVQSALIAVPANSLLLAWAKNENSATATALDGFSLDAGSTSFLWAESKLVDMTGSYAGHFQYSAPIGWQTAIVGLQVPKGGNHAPIASNGNISTLENVVVNGTLLATDAEGNPLTYSVVANGAKGTAVVTNASTGAYTYTPNASATGTDTFTFKANDGQVDSNVATITVTVTPTATNHAPVASAGTIGAPENTAVSGTLVAADADGNPLTFSIVTNGTKGTATVTDASTGAYTYTPNANATGTDTFTFKANDGQVDSNVATITVTLTPPGPAIVATQGYINGSALTSHPSTAFNSVGSSTLIAFVSTNTPWNGLPVSIGAVTDSVGNTWSLLAGPTTWVGGSFTLVSAIYYVNAPATSTTHTVTVNLSNPAPLVFHVLAVSGSDTSGPPVFSSITDPGAGTSTDVQSALIAVPANSLLLAWVKNENSATATALDGFSLDAGSTSFLWAESKLVQTAGSYAGHFQYAASIGWQTAIVGVTAPTTGNHAPIASDTSISTPENVAVNGTLVATDEDANPLTFSIVANGTKGTAVVTDASTGAYTYTPNASATGADTFTFKANDGQLDSNIATITVTITGTTPPPPAPVITLTPASLTNQTSASFSFTDTQAGVTFVCQLDGGGFSACSSPAAYAGPLAAGSHTFAVKAQDAASNQSGAASFTWTIDLTTPPAPVITSAPANRSNQSSATFGFTDSEAGVTFQCQLDGSAFSSCTSPITYAGPLSDGGHTFGVRARDVAGNLSTVTADSWHIDATAPPTPTITSKPANPTNQTSASFRFSDTDKKTTFQCQLDGSAFTSCSSPKAYSRLNEGGHTFAVVARDNVGNVSSPATYAWTIDATPPPAPAITYAPPNPSTATTASFSFSDTEAGVTFQCKLDGGAFVSCSSPQTYSSLSQGSHTFAVRARDAAGNLSSATNVAWMIDSAATAQVFTATPANPTNQTSATFAFTDTEGGISFVCSLDGSAYNPCASPVAYAGPLSQGIHVFSVRAQDSVGNLSTPTTFTWTIDTTPPPAPIIASVPSNPSNFAKACFTFSDAEATVGFACSLDGSTATACNSGSQCYTGLASGSHTFSVIAQDAATNQSSPAGYRWLIR